MTESLKLRGNIIGRDYEAAENWLDKSFRVYNQKSDLNTYKKALNLSKRLGVTHDRLDQLSIIHVGGSKGKGSVCAMCENMLRKSGFKTEFLRHLKDIIIKGGTVDVPQSSAIRNLGVVFDQTMSVTEHVKAITKSVNFHLPNIYRIRRFITFESCHHLVRSLILSRIDYTNSLLYGMLARDRSKLQISHRYRRIEQPGRYLDLIEGHQLLHSSKSSPHLVDFCERIRIDGKPLAKDKFTRYFFYLYDRLWLDDYEMDTENGIKGTVNGEESTEDGMQCTGTEVAGTENEEGSIEGEDFTEDGPEGIQNGLFARYFLTMMAYHVFMEEKVDVAVIEVGLGGKYDSTNIHRCPTVVGITLVDYDHVSVLGRTIGEIASVKAGICKPGRPAFTIKQPENGLDAIKKGAEAEKASSILLCPPLSSYDFRGHPIQIGIAGDHQSVNASMALQLCKTWMETTKRENFELVPNKSNKPLSNAEIKYNGGNALPMAHPFILPDSFIKGLKTCYWPGRTQVVNHDRITYYMDGAHSPSSVKACLAWFDGASKTEAEVIDKKGVRVIIFNISRDRDYATLLKTIMNYHFDGVVFCPSVQNLNNDRGRPGDFGYLKYNYKDQVVKCRKMESTYNMLLNQRSNTSQQHTNPKVMVLSCVQEAFEWVARSTKTAEHAQVLVTGSLYLVAAALAILDPKLALEL